MHPSSLNRFVFTRSGVHPGRVGVATAAESALGLEEPGPAVPDALLDAGDCVVMAKFLQAVNLLRDAPVRQGLPEPLGFRISAVRGPLLPGGAEPVRPQGIPGHGGAGEFPRVELLRFWFRLF